MSITKSLRDAYTNSSFGIFIGAGISQASGLPNWENLLLQLIDLAQDNGTSTDKIDDLKTLTKNPANYLMVAEELKELLGSDLYKYIKRTFENSTNVPSDLLKKIIELKHKFIVTTNYDTLVEQAFILKGITPNDFTYKEPSSVNSAMLNGDRFILKAHGDCRRAPTDIVITEKDYRNIIFKESGYQSVLSTIFSMYHVLFLGASLKDPELKLLLSYIHDSFHGGTPDHFAFMNKNEIGPTEISRWNKDFNIKVITYDPKDNYKELNDYIDELSRL